MGSSRITFDAARRRWRWVLLSVVAACLLIMGLWPRGLHRADVRVAPLPAVSRATTESARGPRTVPVSSAFVPAIGQALSPTLADCEAIGLKLNARGEPEEALNPALFGRVKEVREATLRAMAESQDDLARAVALFVDRGKSDPPGEREGVDSLARLAIASRNPQIYALAFEACGPSRSDICQMLSIERWAELDPTNARPWMHMAFAAKEAHDSAGIDDAMHHIAKAGRLDDGRGVTLRKLLEFAPTGDAAALGRLQLVVETVGVYAAMVVHYETISQYCGVSLLRDANRRQVCSEVAHTLVQRSDSLMNLMIGTAVGQRTGCPGERIAELKLQRQVWTLMMTKATAVGPGLSDCQALRGQVALMDELAREGELGAARRAVERSGKTLAELASGG